MASIGTTEVALISSVALLEMDELWILCIAIPNPSF